MAVLEHVNVTVRDPRATAETLAALFGWRVRWEGAAKDDGFTVHVGSDASYLALYRPAPGNPPPIGPDRLNHIAVTVDDLDAVEKRVKARGYEPFSHADYEPGRRFYFLDENGLEFEVVQYD